MTMGRAYLVMLWGLMPGSVQPQNRRGSAQARCCGEKSKGILQNNVWKHKEAPWSGTSMRRRGKGDGRLLQLLGARHGVRDGRAIRELEDRARIAAGKRALSGRADGNRLGVH